MTSLATEYESAFAGTVDGGQVGTSSTEKVGFWGATPVVQQSALTTQLTTITIADAAGTPDYAIQAVTNTNAYGFAAAQEAISFLYVVKNLQTRVAELEALLETIGIVAAN